MGRIHVWLTKHDIARLDSIIPKARLRSKILRSMVNKYLNAIEAQVQEAIDEHHPPRPITIEINAEGE